MPDISVAGALGVVALTIALAAVFLLLLRLVDMNEKEPAWAMVVVFTSGAGCGLLLYVLVPSTTLQLTSVRGPLLTVVAVVAGLAVGLAVVDALGAERGGGSQVGGALDGLVYGAAAGTGVASGVTFVQQLQLSSDTTLATVPGDMDVGTLAILVLTGLAYGLFGAVSGAGIGAAYVTSSYRRLLVGGAGIAGSAVSALLYSLLAFGGSLTSAGRLLTIAALTIPAAALAAVAVAALRRERRAMNAWLDAEVSTGSITAADARLLRSPAARRAAYWRRLQRRDIDGWGDLRALHNHQMRLLLARDRAERATDPRQAQRCTADMTGLRVAIAAIRAENPTLQTAAPTPLGG